MFLIGRCKRALWWARLPPVNGKGILRSISWALPYHKLHKKCVLHLRFIVRANMH